MVRKLDLLKIIYNLIYRTSKITCSSTKSISSRSLLAKLRFDPTGLSSPAGSTSSLSYPNSYEGVFAQML